MNKVICFSLLALLLGLSSVSADADTWSKPGTLTAQAGVGLHWGGLAEVQGGVDYGLGQIPFAPTFPLDLGVSGRLVVSTGGFGAGVYGTAHYSWKALRTGQRWLDGWETYLGIGLGLVPGFGLDAYGGLSYHFNKDWAVYGEGALYGSVLGASYRF